jgi:hypothetical protein
MLKNSKHEHFAGLVAKGVSATEAAVTAGFSQRRAVVTASELLARPDVKARIAELNVIIAERVTEKTGVDKAWVLNQLVEVVSMGKAAEPVRDAQGEPTGEYKQNLAAANKALELIGKELAMFVDRSEVRTGPLDGVEHDDIRAIAEAISTLTATQQALTTGAGSTRH